MSVTRAWYSHLKQDLVMQSFLQNWFKMAILNERNMDKCLIKSGKIVA